MESDKRAPTPPLDVVTHRQGETTKRIVNEHNFDFEGWKITVQKSTILPSNCYCDSVNDKSKPNSPTGPTNDISSTPAIPNEAVAAEAGGTNTGTGTSNSPQLCQVCRFSSELALKHLPEMVFPDNILRIRFLESNFSLTFNALDAMKLISDATDTGVYVAFAEEWKAAQDGSQLSNEIKYDWTYATNYKGTLKLPNEVSSDFKTNEKLNLEKLKEREAILFYDELALYEDELHDNGTSNLSVKIRVMPSGFFILQRFFLRVDNVMAKIRDTRVHFEKGNNYLIREFQERKGSVQTLSHLSSQSFSDPNLLYQHLPIIYELTDKIRIK